MSQRAAIAANASAAKAAYLAQRIDHFAELLAEGSTMTAASQALGIGISTGREYLGRIRAGLGEQAR